MKKLIIVLSGKKDAGKTTFANQIAAEWLSLKRFGGDSYSFGVNDYGKLIVIDGNYAHSLCVEHGVADPNETKSMGVRVIAFASPLKDFCVNVLNLTNSQCYGSNDLKNTLTSVKWDHLPISIRFKYRSHWYSKPRSGPMTGREVMQVFGTDMIRAWSPDAWALSGYNLAVSIPEPLVIISDARFYNEVEIGYEIAVETEDTSVCHIRLKRNVHTNDIHPSECALDGCDDMFHYIIPPTVSVSEQAAFVRSTISPLLKSLIANVQLRKAA